MDSTNTELNIVFGSIINLLYLEDDCNLAAVVVEDQSSNKTYTFAIDPDITPELYTFQVNNLSAFQSRIEQVFNYNNLVSIKCENNKIISLVLVRSLNTDVVSSDTAAFSTRGGGPKCCIPGYCKSK